MPKNLQGRRSELDAAIALRNEAAKRVESADSALVECIGEPEAWPTSSGARSGEKLRALRNEGFQATERREAIEEEKREIERRSFGDKSAALRHFMKKYDGKSADEVLKEIDETIEAVRSRQAAMELDRDKLAIICDEAAFQLQEANKALDISIMAVLQEQITPLTEEIEADTRALLKKLGALDFATRSISFDNREQSQNFRDAGHLIRMFSTLGALIASGDAQSYAAERREGQVPWQAAYNKLAVDASAPLPCEAS